MREAQDRAWEVVRRAFEERTVAPRRSRRWVAVVAVAAAAVIVTAVVSPPGRAVFQRVREAVGVEHADPALFSLPAPGRLLVVSENGGGVWLVHDDGFKRRLGPYDDAQWSPHGLYVVAIRGNELFALDVDKGVRWTLARRHVSFPRWEGTKTDTRIAYLTPAGLHVVAGDGTDDRLLARHVAAVPPAWQPAQMHTVAYATAARSVVLRSADTNEVLWRAPLQAAPQSLVWSSDGHLLAAVSPQRIEVLTSTGKVARLISTLTGTFETAAFRPGAHQLAVSIGYTGRSETKLIIVDHPGSARLLFAGPGRFGDIAWSPNGRWLLVDWPTANQWVFLHGSRVHAVSNIREEFRRVDDVVPSLRFANRWCCR
jgi:dipeptidyl aminopeptidase/acylaminoacyl peptidase